MCSIEGFTGPQPFTIEEYTKFNRNKICLKQKIYIQGGCD